MIVRYLAHLIATAGSPRVILKTSTSPQNITVREVGTNLARNKNESTMEDTKI